MKIEKDDYTIDIDKTPELMEKVFDRVLAFYIEHETFMGEAIQQADEPIMDAPSVLSDIADNIIKFDVKWKD